MTSLTSRLYRAPADLQALIDFLLATRPPARITDFPSVVDLHELLALPAVQRNTRLWFDEQGRLTGFALVDHYHNLRFELDRQSAPPGLMAEMVAWGEACMRRVPRESDTKLTLDASCRADDQEQIDLLRRHGFVPQAWRSLQMARALDEPIPTPQLPEGFTIRSVAGEEEVEALVALHRAAFGSKEMTVSERLAMMRVPEYDPALDLLAIAPDGRFAATCFCAISTAENARSGRNEGYTDPIATHPDFRRRGLARALLFTGLQLLQERGMDTAVLGTSSENIAMQKTAVAAGFQIASTTVWFAKMVCRLSR